MSKKRKSIVSSFGDFTAQSGDSSSQDTAPKRSEKPKQASRVGAGIIGATKRTLTDIREERDRLLAVVENGDALLSLKPDDIDPSPFKDRLPDDSSENYELFKATIKDEGQKVPITVRRHPDREHRYQVVFGHRRCRALKELGREIKAQVVDYSDRDLVVAQGIENASRQDLSWIEKALFASRMEKTGIKPKDIKAALSVDDAQLSKFRVVTRALDVALIEAIGRAPSIGRPRWLELVDRAQANKAFPAISKTLSNDKVLSLPSDDRFLAAMGSASGTSSKTPPVRKQASTKLDRVGLITFDENAIRLSLDKAYAEDFTKFFESEIEALVSRFLEARDDQD